MKKCLILAVVMLISIIISGPIQAQITNSFRFEDTVWTMKKIQLSDDQKRSVRNLTEFPDKNLNSLLDGLSKDSTSTIHYGKLPRYSISGIGGTASGEAKAPDMASARFLVEWNPYFKIFSADSLGKLKYFTRFTGTASFNKGSGLETVESEEGEDGPSFGKKSLIFPEMSNSAFMSRFSMTSATYPHDNGSSYLDFLGPFVEYSWQTRTINKGDEALSFDASTWNWGFDLVSGYYKFSDQFFMVGFSLFYSRLNISEGSTDDFRAIFDDDQLDHSFSGLGSRISFSYSNLIIEFEYRDYDSRNGMNGDGITGGQYTIKTAIKGVILSE